MKADLAGWNLAATLTDPDDCWRAVCELRSYAPPGPIANCEMAFARTAIVRRAIRAAQAPKIAQLMLAAIDRLIAEQFSTEDTEETRTYYSGRRLADVAPEIIQFYEENAIPPGQLAYVFASRLRVPGIPSLEIRHLFASVGESAERLMRDVTIVP